MYTNFLILATNYLIITVTVSSSEASKEEKLLLELIDLPQEQLPYYFSSVDGDGNNNANFGRLSRSRRSTAAVDGCLSSSAVTKTTRKTGTGQQEEDEEEEDGEFIKPFLNQSVCWGYEEYCEDNLDINSGPPPPVVGQRRSRRTRYSTPSCSGDSKGWAKSKSEQLSIFYSQADFGYVKKFRDSLQLYCKPERPGDSSLECSENLTFCRGKNLMIDLREIGLRTKPIMYDMDVLRPGQIGGHCKLDSGKLKANLEFMSSLQSWAPELRNFVELEDQVAVTVAGKSSLNSNNPGSSADGQETTTICDVTISKPTFLMKIDATVNMYHHFCDFFNLYASLHTNLSTTPTPTPTPIMTEPYHYHLPFTKDVQLLIWRTYKLYQSNFQPAFQAFTMNPLLDLSEFVGKRVCFEDVVFSLLPRMIFGLYYNTPLIWGCEKSGLFHAFSKFMLHRLRIPQRSSPDLSQIKVTFLSRRTKYRKILNEDILIAKLKENSQLNVRKVEFTFQTDFLDQLSIITDTDILIGIHGAGLTHLLFLPDWAAVFEIYNCQDPHCYADLCRLRGLKYLTWQDEEKFKVYDKDPKYADSYYHKHANYKFNPAEFEKIVQEGVEHVRSYQEGHSYHNDNDDDDGPSTTTTRKAHTVSAEKVGGRVEL